VTLQRVVTWPKSHKAFSMAISSKSTTDNTNQWYDSLERWSKVRDDERDASHFAATDAEGAHSARTTLTLSQSQFLDMLKR
jgi:hypothetical protein